MSLFLPWVRRGLRTGVVTTRYPAIQELPVEGFRGRPLLDADRCLAGQGCQACAQVCLPQALLVSIDEDGHVQQITLDDARCIMCGLCVTACPTGALTMSTAYELAATTHENLKHHVRFIQKTHTDGEAYL